MERDDSKKRTAPTPVYTDSLPNDPMTAQRAEASTSKGNLKLEFRSAGGRDTLLIRLDHDRDGRDDEIIQVDNSGASSVLQNGRRAQALDPLKALEALQAGRSLFMHKAIGGNDLENIALFALKPATTALKVETSVAAKF